jgi:gas vesicle protein
MARKASDVWPYIIVGSAVGGAVGYLFATDSGRKVRRAITHPDELADNIDEVRAFIERKAEDVTGRVRTVIDRAKESMEAGQRAFEEANQGHRTNMQRMEDKNNQIASTVHKNVDNLKTTAYTVEQSLLDPLYEALAMYRGFRRGVRTMLGRTGEVAPFRRSGTDRGY